MTLSKTLGRRKRGLRPTLFIAGMLMTMLPMVSNVAMAQPQAWPQPTFSGGQFVPGTTWTLSKGNEFSGATHNFSSGAYSEAGGFTFSARHDAGKHDEWYSNANARVEGGYLKLWGQQQACPVQICGGVSKAYSGAEVIAGNAFTDASGNSHFGYYEAELYFPENGADFAWRLGEKNGSAIYKQAQPVIALIEASHPAFSTCRRIKWRSGPSAYDVTDNPYANFGNFFDQGVQPASGAPCVQSSYDAQGYANISGRYETPVRIGLWWTPGEMRVYVNGVQAGNAISLASQGLMIEPKLRMAFSFNVLAASITNPGTLAQPMTVNYVRYYVLQNPINPPKAWGVVWNNLRFQSQTTTNSMDPSISGAASTDSRFYAGNYDDSNPGDELVWIHNVPLAYSKMRVLRLDATGANSLPASWSQLDECGTCGQMTMYGNARITTGNFVGNGKEEAILFTGNGSLQFRLLEYIPSSATWLGISNPSVYPLGMQVVRLKYSTTSGANDAVIQLGSDGNLWIGRFENGSSPYFLNGNALWGCPSGTVCTTIPNGSGQTLWTFAEEDTMIVGNFTGDSRHEILFLAESGLAKLLDFSYTGGASGTWSQLWTSGTPGQPGYNGIGGFMPNTGDKYLVGDWNDDGYDEIAAISPTGQYVKILKYASGSWSSVWGNAGNGKIADWWLRGTDKFAVGNLNPDAACNANDQLFLSRGELMSGSHKWRANLYFSPLSQFWSNSVHNKVGPEVTEVASAMATEARFSLFPNPSSGRFEVAGGQVERMRVRDASGRVLLETKAYSIDLGQQPAGMYFIEVTASDGSTQVMKAIKQ